MKKYLKEAWNKLKIVLWRKLKEKLRRPETVSLRELYRRVGEVAAAHGEDFYSIRAEMRHGEIKLQGYINNFNHTDDCNTIDEVCNELLEMRSDKKSKIKDVKI